MPNATPDAMGPRESSPETASAPTDLIGRRPLGEGPVGTIGLIRLTFATLRFNFWRLVVITLYVSAVGFGLSLLVCCPLNITLQGHPLWLRYLSAPLYVPIFVPLMAGYAYAVLLQVLGLNQRGPPTNRERGSLSQRPCRGWGSLPGWLAPLDARLPTALALS